MQEKQFRSVGWEDPLEKEMVTHSSILVWENPMDRGAWWATFHGVRVRQDLATKQQQSLKSEAVTLAMGLSGIFPPSFTEV